MNPVLLISWSYSSFDQFLKGSLKLSFGGYRVHLIFGFRSPSIRNEVIVMERKGKRDGYLKLVTFKGENYALIGLTG